MASIQFESPILGQYYPEVTITLNRYNQLIQAEQEAKMLKSLIHEKAVIFDHFTFEDIRLLDKMFNPPDKFTEDSEE